MPEMKIKVSEIFYSLQGEGLYQGTPSVFLRTFGCNFTCSGYSMPLGQKSEERLAVDPAKYEKYDDLPLVHTGCDSYASWDVRFKHLSIFMTIDEIADKIRNLVRKFDSNVHLIITGGEPLLGWQRAYPLLLAELYPYGLTHVTFETNGTQRLHKDLIEFLENADLLVTFTIRSKLPSSGEAWDKAIQPDVIKEYGRVGVNNYFKWVVSSQEDILSVIRAHHEYNQAGISIPVYLMPAGGTTKHYEENKKWVAKLAKDYGFRYSPRLQIDLYGNAWGT